jgi:hypothetical protein
METTWLSHGLSDIEDLLYEMPCFVQLAMSHACALDVLLCFHVLLYSYYNMMRCVENMYVQD